MSETLRVIISRFPSWLKPLVTDTIALLVYFPLARLALLGERLGLKMNALPLYFKRDKSLYTMRTDSRDRFGTPLERRFTRVKIEAMMKRTGLVEIDLLEEAPYWCALGRKH